MTEPKRKTTKRKTKAKTVAVRMRVGGEHDGERFEAGDVLDLSPRHWIIRDGLGEIEESDE